MNAKTRRNVLYYFFLASFILLTNLACSNVPQRVVLDAKLCPSPGACLTVGRFDEIGAENKRGVEALRAGDNATAYKIWKTLAEKGDAGEFRSDFGA